jgi:O-antigen/teichoic acid export membrane protein
MKAFQRIAQNTSYIFAAQFINKLLNVVFIVYAARLLGATNYGLFVLVSTMVLICSTFTHLGIRAMIVRKISKDMSSARQLLGNVLAFRLCLSGFIYALLVFFSRVSGYPQEVTKLIDIAGILIIVNIFTESFETIYISHEKMRPWGTFDVLHRLVFTIAVITALWLGFRLKAVFSLNVLVSAMFAGALGFFIWKNIFRFKLEFDFLIIKGVLRESILFFFAVLLNTLIIKVDILMLSFVGGPMEPAKAIGYYGPAHNILLALMILPRSVNTALLPFVSQKIYLDHESVKRAIEKATKFLIITICLPLIFAVSFFSKEIVLTVFGANFIQSTDALMILGWAYAFYALNIPAQSVLGSSTELKKFIPLLALVLLLNVFFNYILIPKYSYVGAAIATCIVFFVGFIGRFYFLRKILGTKISDMKDYIKCVVILVIILGSSFLVKSFVPKPALILWIIIAYISCLCIFGLIAKKDIVGATAWISKKAPRSKQCPH